MKKFDGPLFPPDPDPNLKSPKGSKGSTGSYLEPPGLSIEKGLLDDLPVNISWSGPTYYPPPIIFGLIISGGLDCLGWSSSDLD